MFFIQLNVRIYSHLFGLLLRKVLLLCIHTNTAQRHCIAFWGNLEIALSKVSWLLFGS